MHAVLHEQLTAAVLVRRYTRCLRLQHGGVPARLRPRDDLRRLLAAAAEAIHPWSDGERPAQAAPGQVPAISPHVVALACRLSLEVAQVVAMPTPRKHAVVLHCMP